MSRILLHNGIVSPAVRPPVLSSFTTVNTGSFTVANYPGGVNLSGSTNGTAYTFAGLVTSFSSNQTLTVRLMVQAQWWLGAVEFGLFARDSASSKLAGCSIDTTAAGASTVTLRKMTDNTTFSANYTTVATLENFASDVWLRLTDDGSNRKFSIGADPISMHEVHSIGRTDFLTANQAGFFVNFGRSTTGTAISCSLVSWSLV